MLRSTGSQRVGHNLVTEKKKVFKNINAQVTPKANEIKISRGGNQVSITLKTSWYYHHISIQSKLITAF